jgi:hypothetical protein
MPGALKSEGKGELTIVKAPVSEAPPREKPVRDTTPAKALDPLGGVGMPGALKNEGKAELKIVKDPVSEAPAADTLAGNIAAIESESVFYHVTIKRAGETREAAAVSGDAVYLGDTVRTYTGVKAQISLSDGSHILISPNSSVEMKSCLADRQAGKRRAVFKALEGTIRFRISKTWKNKASGVETQWRDSEIKVETPVVVIAGVRGIDFTAAVSGLDVELAVLDGVVALKSSMGHQGEVLLAADQVSHVAFDAPPTPPTALTPEMREKLIRDTTPAKTLKSLGGVRRPGAQKKNGKGKLGIARDLAAGIPLREIINEAVKEGVSIQAVMSHAVTEGVYPALVVYTTITEGYPAASVVTAAITAGIPLDSVVNASLEAGAGKQDVYAGAVEAGLSPTSVADAIASAVKSKQ